MDLKSSPQEPDGKLGSFPHTQLEIQLGHFCNNRCVFCVSGHLSAKRQAPFLPLKSVHSTMVEQRELGAMVLTILGGEPTLHPDFLATLTLALDLKFPRIVIFTNGARGHDPDFLDTVLALPQARPRLEWRVSLQGADQSSHEAVTRRPGSWARLLGFLDALHLREQRISANTCLCAQNYRSLPALPKLLSRYGVEQYHLDSFRPSGAGDCSPEALAPVFVSYSLAAPFIDRLLDGIPDGCDASIGNFPYCLLPHHAARLHHGGEATLSLTTGELDSLDRLNDKQAFQRQDCVYASSCPECVFFPICRGVPDAYSERFTLGELSPCSWEDLAALWTGPPSNAPPNDGLFTLRALRWAAPLLDEPPAPERWTLQTLHHDRKQNSLNLHWHHPHHRPRVLGIGPPAQALRKLIEASFDSMAAAALPAYTLRWSPSRPDSTLSSWVDARLPWHVRSTTDLRLLRALRTLRAAPLPAPWRLGPSSLSAKEATFVLLDLEDKALEIRLSHSPRAAEAHFTYEQGPVPLRLEPMVQHLANVLRSRPLTSSAIPPSRNSTVASGGEAP